MKSILKTLKFSFVLLYLVLGVFTSSASHYMGGEISWECMPNGNYRFFLKLYRECSGITFSNTEILKVSNHPSLGTLTLKLIERKDISPVCNNAYPNIVCDSSATTANTGAVELWTYSTDSVYPNGVVLNGVPPLQGWVFIHTSCCRNPCTNIQNSSNFDWFLRAVMYSYNGQNANQCFDNSPIFAEKPMTAVCSGYPITFNSNVSDPDMDSLAFDWAQPLDGISTPISSYSTGYNFQNPFPDTSINPLNIPAVINHITGDVSLTSFTNGAFVNVIKVTSYKCGIKISEVFRETQLVILSCVANAEPMLTLIDSNGTHFSNYVDTVNVGASIYFKVIASDSGLLPNGTNQTITLNAFSKEFGQGFVNPSGCAKPPCAMLSIPVPLIGMEDVTTEFNWQTDCSHLLSATQCNNLEYQSYRFVFAASDDYCPVPAVSSLNVTIVVRSVPVLKSPSFDSIKVNHANGDVSLFWTPPIDSANTFDSYHIYYSPSLVGIYTPLDSSFNYFQNSYLHIGGAATVYNSGYYFLKTRSGCSKAIFSKSSDTLFFNYSGINETQRDEISLSLFPNPAHGSTKISFIWNKNFNNIEVEIYDVSGSKIRNIIVNSGIIDIDLTGIKPGAYLICVKEEKNLLARKILLVY